MVPGGVYNSDALENLDELRQEVERLRERSSRLNSAILRISTSLDPDTVLREIVDSGRALTGARYGVIATVGGSGEVTELVSSGFTAEEHERMTSWPDGPRLFAHFQELPAPVRLGDLPAYVEKLGFSSDLMVSKTMLGVSMRHRGVAVGSFFLAEKERGRDFTDDDEEILVLLASQAGAAIANARSYADEQRARAELETLVEHAPVGVVIFDAANGEPVSFNHEARRIVRGLRMPGRSVEELLAIITFRRSDGREISLDEFPIAGQLSTGERVHAEEIELLAPDGRSVTTLINALPIHSAAGNVQSVVVTMQDLASLQQLERLRAEFVGLVSHELRTPLTSIKGAATTALASTPTLDREELVQFFHIINAQADHMHGLVSDLLDTGRIETGTLSVTPERIHVVDLVDEARRVFLNSGAQHTLRLDLPLDLPPVNADRRRIVQVLNNLFTNAARHSPSHSPIRVTAVRDGIHLAISVTDEGRGLPAELLPNLFRKHSGLRMADAEAPSEATGLGLAICKGLVEAHGGRIWAESGGANQGTRFTFTLAVAEEEGDAGVLAAAASRPLAPDGGKTGVLVVDDDPQTLRYVKEALGSKGYSVVVTGDPEEIPGLIRKHQPRLVLLDLLFQGTDGVELMERIPELGDLPVIFISAYGRDETIARALETGAVDYIVKPFSPTELTARVRAALRQHAEPAPFNLGALAIHYGQRRVTLEGRPLELTGTEYEMLRVLSENAGRVTTYDSLLRRVWGSKNSTDPKLVRSFAKKLRKKLEDDPANPAYIFTERGVGYRMGGSESEPG